MISEQISIDEELQVTHHSAKHSHTPSASTFLALTTGASVHLLPSAAEALQVQHNTYHCHVGF